MSIPAAGRSSKRRGETYTTKSIEISQIESKRLEKQKSGLIYYSFKANARNRTKGNIEVSVCFQAVDRSGYELEEACFWNKTIRKNGTATLTDKLVMDTKDYQNIWEWKIERLSID